MMTLNAIRQALALPQSDDASIGKFCLDSRKVQSGDVFIALEGERVDGHHFVLSALKAGAQAVIADPNRVDVKLHQHPAFIPVSDPRKALMDLAAAWRHELQGEVVAITGSNGKTTTKDLLIHLLGTKRASANSGNLNSTLGAPLAMLNESRIEDSFYVMEIGASRPREIAAICATCRPTYGMITTIGSAHLEAFGSLDGVARAKRELWDWLVENNGTAVVNMDDPRIRAQTENFPRRSSYSLQSNQTGATFVMEYLGMDQQACAQVRLADEEFTLPVPGWAFLSCTFAAVAYAGALGLTETEIKDALRTVSGTSNRMELRSVAGWTILDDCYNANPDSMKEALRTLKATTAGGERVAVLAAMEELGTESLSLHRGLGKVASEAGLDRLILVGSNAELKAVLDAYEEAEGCGAALVPTIADAAHLLGTGRSGDILLVKGSRSSHLEELFEELQQ
jgi:UDP-N-acetylmuramoyl-tripeptide--D-alanyl-D-alanine ligase